ncbi:AI-2E family transporter [Amycolatopsis sp. NPDC023774]|uniref:AI-2E family transporter n=1 Tax=Amycolatopsis sp. NPDC023774 TaxID=3155015 RepID=UPI0033FA3D69
MNQVLSYLPNLLAALLIFLVAAAVAGAIGGLVHRTMGDTPTGKIVRTLVPAMIMGIAVFMILTQLGISPAGMVLRSDVTSKSFLRREFLLMVFCLIFFLAHGGRIWSFLLGAVPVRVRHRMDLAGRAGFTTLAGYIRGTAAVAVINAVGVGVGLLIVGVPLAAPLATLVFLGAFVPVVGSVVAGAVAVLVALVTGGILPAIIVLAIVIGVMQLESHVLQPFLLGRVVRLHPLAVVLALATGLVTAGIIGALLAVPLLAVLSSARRNFTAPPRPSPRPRRLRPEHQCVVRLVGADLPRGTEPFSVSRVFCPSRLAVTAAVRGGGDG